MKTFLKILLAVLAVLVCLKILPFLFGVAVVDLAGALAAGVVLVGGVASLAAVGLSVVAAILAVVLVAAAVLAPIWLPVLAVVGLISLCRRNRPVTA